MIRGTCPVCGRTFKVDDRYAGMSGKCRTCGAAVTVPGEPDVGLDGLPPLPNGAQQAEPQLEQAQQPEPAPDAPDVPPATAPAPEPEPQPEPAADRPHAAELPSDDGREDDTDGAPLGATAIRGHWLRQEPSAAPEEAPQPEPEPPPDAEQVLGTANIVTAIDTTDTDGRPFVLTFACIVLGLLGVGFCLKVASAGLPGLVMAGIAIVLVVLGVVRLWTGHWDGLIPAFVLCIGVAGAVVLLTCAGLEEGQMLTFALDAIALLAGAGLALLLLILSLLSASARDHLAG